VIGFSTKKMVSLVLAHEKASDSMDELCGIPAKKSKSF